MQNYDESRSLTTASWAHWKDKLTVFQGWRKQKHSALVRRWWNYLFSVFFQEVTEISCSDKICLDVGCGCGGYLSHLVKNHCSAGVGLDPLKSSLKASKVTLKGNKVSEKVDLILGVAEYIPLKEESVGLCIMTGSLDHVNEPDQAAREFYRVLSRNSHLMLLETVLSARQSNFYDDTHSNQFTIGTLTGYLKQFRIVKILRKYPFLSQIHVPEFVVDCCFSVMKLRKLPGALGSLFNYSEVLLKCEKN
jgi:ubiquinone/menaquinone biosynthesis C-methylase UbiE